MSATDAILQNISQQITLDKSEQDFFISQLEPKRVRRRQFLYTEGETARNAAFVYKGCLKAYSLDANGMEHILQFAPPGWWISDFYSYISQKPGNLNIEAIFDSEVLLLSRKNQLKLFDRCPKFERLFRILLENSLVRSHQRLIDSLSLTAKQRYNHFCKYYPGLIDKLPQKMVASYIGVTPEFLSKMLSQKAGS